MTPLEADKKFFAALIAADADVLDRILTADFILVDVMSGSEITKAALLDVVRSGALKFESIEPADNRVRLYQTTAIITGRTEMKGKYAGAPFAAISRYTHVFVEQNGDWRLASAQGTPIASSPRS